MLPLGPLAALALGSLRQHWRVTLALLLGSLLLSGALAAVPITHERLRDAALRDSLATAPAGGLELRVAARASRSTASPTATRRPPSTRPSPPRSATRSPGRHAAARRRR